MIYTGQMEDRAKYHREHYANNKQVYVDRNNRRRKKVQEYIREAKSGPCVDCDGRYPYYVMDFDHLGDKEISIAAAASQGWGIERVAREIAKCELVCANCHRERTHGAACSKAGESPLHGD